jgi:D-threo-aldose 1-dehydrogenase
MIGIRTARIRDVEITTLGLGTAPLGGLFTPVGEDTALATVARGYELGIRFFDTAPLYGYGTAERRLGAGLRAAGLGDATDVVIETKVGRLLRAVEPGDGYEVDLTQSHNGEPFYKDTGPAVPVFDYTYDGALRSFEESLKRLGVDRVGILQVHDPDAHVGAAISGACRAAVSLRDQGVVGAVGVATDFTATATAILAEVDLDAVLIAGRWSLLDHQALDELLPMALERGAGVIAAGVFNSGILAGGPAAPTFDYVPAPREVIDRVARMDEVCRRHGVPLPAAALQFPFRHPAVVSVLTGARSPREVEENVARLGALVPDALWHDLERECGVPVVAGTVA